VVCVSAGTVLVHGRRCVCLLALCWYMAGGVFVCWHCVGTWQVECVSAGTVLVHGRWCVCVCVCLLALCWYMAGGVCVCVSAGTLCSVAWVLWSGYRLTCTCEDRENVCLICSVFCALIGCIKYVINTSACTLILLTYFCFSLSQWPRGLRRGSAAAHLLRSLVLIPPGAWMSVVSVVCCQVEVCATSWSLVQRSPTDCGEWGVHGPLGVSRRKQRNKQTNKQTNFYCILVSYMFRPLVWPSSGWFIWQQVHNYEENGSKCV